MRLGYVSTKEMCEGPLLRKIIRYSIPIVLTGILQFLFNAADIVVVGQFGGHASVGAVGATTSLIYLITNLFIGLSVGAGVATARSLGSRREDEVSAVVHTAMPMAFFCGFLITIVGFLNSRTFLEWMGTPQDVIDLSTEYLKIYFLGMVGNMVFNFGAAILRAAGNTRDPLIFLSVSGVSNVLLNILFVALYKMDVAGVAIATAVTQTFSGILVLVCLVKQKGSLRFTMKQLRMDKKAFLQIVRVGLPAGIEGSLFSISNVLIQSSINSFGSVIMSGSFAAANFEDFIYFVTHSIHQTALTFVGQNTGAKKIERVPKIAGISLACAMSSALVLSLGVFAFGTELLSLYVPDSMEAVQSGIVRITIVTLPLVMFAIMDVLTGVLRGMSVSLVPMIISIVGICCFRVIWIFTIFAAETTHTPEVLYYSYPITWTLCSLAQAIAFGIVFRKKKKMN